MCESLPLSLYRMYRSPVCTASRPDGAVDEITIKGHLFPLDRSLFVFRSEGDATPGVESKGVCFFGKPALSSFRRSGAKCCTIFVQRVDSVLPNHAIVQCGSATALNVSPLWLKSHTQERQSRHSPQARWRNALGSVSPTPFRRTASRIERDLEERRLRHGSS